MIRVSQQAAVSRGVCNKEVVEGFGGFEVAEGFPWSVVEVVGDGLEVGLGVGVEVRAFGEELAE